MPMIACVDVHYAADEALGAAGSFALHLLLWCFRLLVTRGGDALYCPYNEYSQYLDVYTSVLPAGGNRAVQTGSLLRRCRSVRRDNDNGLS